MKADFTKYRDIRKLHPDELKVVVMGLLTTDELTRQRDEAEFREVVDDLTGEGIGVVPPEAPTANGYRQVLSLLAGTLLKVAGATVKAIKGEIATRDIDGLESLINGIYGRMMASASGQPAVKSAAHPANVSGRTVLTPTPGVSPVDGGEDNPALEFLQAIAKGNTSPGKPSPDASAPPVAKDGPKSAESAAVPRRQRSYGSATQWTHCVVREGVTLQLRQDIHADLADPKVQGELAEAVRRQLAALFS